MFQPAQYLIWYLLWTLGTLTLMPLVLAGVFWLARKDMRRTIFVLSVLTLSLGLASAVIFTAILKVLDVGPEFYTGNPITPASDAVAAFLNNLELWRETALLATASLQSAAWILALFHGVQTRRGGWLALIAFCAALSSLAGFIASGTSFLYYVVGNLPVGAFLGAHPFASVLLANTLPLIPAVATLLYSLVGLRPRHGGEGTLTNPVALASGGKPDGVAFVVEDLPRR